MKNNDTSSAKKPGWFRQLRIISSYILFASFFFNPSGKYCGMLAVAQHGSSGPVFFSEEKMTTDIASNDDFSQCVVIQPDGKIVLAGYSHNGVDNDFAVVRYNNNGTPDHSFGNQGRVSSNTKGVDEEGYSVAIQQDGKIVVAGEMFNEASTDFAVLRYNSDGTVDNTFSGDGKVSTSVGASDAYCHSVAVSSSGKIFAAGQCFNGCDWDMALVCYRSDGSPDNSFGVGGKAITDIGNSNDYGKSILIQPDGKIILAGSSSGKFAVMRFDSNGDLDRSFGIKGIAVTKVGGSKAKCNAVAMQEDGKIVAAGWSSHGFTLVRYNINGSLDYTFGSNGILTATAGKKGEYGLSVAIDHSGKILLGGKIISGAEESFAIVRFNSDGSPDNTYGLEGKVISDIDGKSIAIDKNGDVVVAGSSDNGINRDFALVLQVREQLPVKKDQRQGEIKMTGVNGAEQFKVFPNPNNGFFVAQSEIEGEFSVINSLGQKVEIFRLEEKNNYTRNIKNLDNGIYYIIGNNEDQAIIKHVVVAE